MKNSFFSLLITILFSACVSSVSTKTVKQEGHSNSAKGKKLLTEAWLAQGMDKLNNYKTYETQLTDTWNGFVGKASSPWPEPSVDLNLKYALRSFDGQVTFNSGKRKGETEGLQSWKNYFVDNTGNTTFPKKENKKIKFILPAIQYFIELPHRLLAAELITYAGEKEFDGKQYDLVLATWNKIKAHKQNDQYLLWINKETKLAEYCEFTIHENFSSRFFTGSVAYKNYKTIAEVKIPFNMYLFAGSPKTDTTKNLHSMLIKSFTFDSFKEDLLYPNPELENLGDSK